jgi:hypothetical protein
VPVRTRWIIAAVLVVVGAVWIAQGLDLFHGSGFMDGQIVWAVIGAGMVVGGLLVGWTAFKARSRA